jgi:hypothetical protein
MAHRLWSIPAWPRAHFVPRDRRPRRSLVPTTRGCGALALPSAVSLPAADVASDSADTGEGDPPAPDPAPNPGDGTGSPTTADSGNPGASLSVPVRPLLGKVSWG